MGWGGGRERGGQGQGRHEPTGGAQAAGARGRSPRQQRPLRGRPRQHEWGGAGWTRRRTKSGVGGGKDDGGVAGTARRGGASLGPQTGRAAAASRQPATPTTQRGATGVARGRFERPHPHTAGCVPGGGHRLQLLQWGGCAICGWHSRYILYRVFAPCIPTRIRVGRHRGRPATAAGRARRRGLGLFPRRPPPAAGAGAAGAPPAGGGVVGTPWPTSRRRPSPQADARRVRAASAHNETNSTRQKKKNRLTPPAFSDSYLFFMRPPCPAWAGG